jgi:hypothetical protein
MVPVSICHILYSHSVPCADFSYIVVWDAWPLGTTPAKKTTDSDNQWISAINGKPYMMAVSPWFYTRLPQYSKNWNWDSDTLWFDRWESVIDVLPQYVEVRFPIFPMFS